MYTSVTDSKGIRIEHVHIPGFSGKTCAVRYYVDITKNRVGDTIIIIRIIIIIIIKYNSGRPRPSN